MRKFLIAANWKMNGNRDSVDKLANELANSCSDDDTVDWVVCPSSVHISQVQQMLCSTPIAVGAQSVSDSEDGAFTGDISAAMIKDQGCEFVIIGHSERRTYHHETNSDVVAQLEKALNVGLKPIICIGESAEQRQAGLVEQTIHQQLQPVLDSLPSQESLAECIIAYEPIWAIGTGVNATPEQAQSAHHAIRQMLMDYDSELAALIRVIYGGSVKSSNAASLFEMPDIDGALVGGASLLAQEFLKIGELCNRSYC